MKMCWCTLNVNNMEESLKFYENVLGLSLVRRFSPNEGVEISFLSDGQGAEVELICNRHETISNRGTGISLGFQVESLLESQNMMKELGINIHRGPIKAGLTSFFFIHDPNGIEIQIVEEEEK